MGFVLMEGVFEVVRCGVLFVLVEMEVGVISLCRGLIAFRERLVVLCE